MELLLTYYGDPVLRKKCQPVGEITDEIKKLVEDMIDTMEANDGIGLAAPQVGKLLRIFITYVPLEDDEAEGGYIDGKLRVFINPEILEFSEEKIEMVEGCLSIPTIKGDVVRPYRVKIKFMDLEGNTQVEEFTDLEAHCVLHENDHINGVLFIDRIRGKERKLLDTQLRKVKEQYYTRWKKK
jgi:peptide deformylase